ncbi:UNVERIFIED_CONTAM: hypothetical protein HDU68_008714, partial [Siphonaria sp. JEL0065]
FPLELPDPTSTTAVSYQSLTNPVLHANNDRVYRMYKHYLCNTQNSQVEVLFEKLQRIAIQWRLDLEEKKRADMLQIILNGGSEDQLTGAKNTLEAIKRDLEGFMDLTTPSHPLTGWELNFPFLSMPFCGPTVHHAMKSMPATPERVKALLLSLLNSSLLPLEAAKTAHMDLRRQNICLRNSIETWADGIVIDLDFCVDYSKNTENPMDTTIPQYPPETIVNAKSDVWMVGYLLLEFGVCGSGWENIKTQKSIEKWIVQAAKAKQSSSGVFVEALQLAKMCLVVKPKDRLSFTQMKGIVEAWKC